MAEIQSEQAPQTAMELLTPKDKQTKEMILDIGEAKAWYAAFNEFKESVISSNPKFYADIVIRGKQVRMINRSGWRAIGQAFHLNDEIVQKEVIEHKDGSFTVVIQGRVFHPASGRSVQSMGACSSNEPNKGWSPTYHNVFAIAHTRMKNRGISDICGSGETSSEEFTDDHVPKPLTDAEKEAREKVKDIGKPMNKTFDCSSCGNKYFSSRELVEHMNREHASSAGGQV